MGGGASVWSKNKGGRAPPLDPPLCNILCSTIHKIKTNKNAPTVILHVLQAIKQNRHPKPNQLLTKNIPCSLLIRTDTVRLYWTTFTHRCGKTWKTFPLPLLGPNIKAITRAKRKRLFLDYRLKHLFQMDVFIAQKCLFSIQNIPTRFQKAYWDQKNELNKQHYCAKTVG